MMFNSIMGLLMLALMAAAVAVGWKFASKHV